MGCGVAFYGLCFLPVLPLYRLGAPAPTTIAVSGALILPRVLHAVQQELNTGAEHGS